MIAAYILVHLARDQKAASFKETLFSRLSKGIRVEIATSDTSISIQIWHDVICPLCLIGHQRLQKALDVFAERDNVKFIYRSFRLAPGVHSRSGNEESLMIPERRPARGDTLDAHRVIQLAKTKGLQREVVCRLQRGYLEKASLFDHPTLIHLARPG